MNILILGLIVLAWVGIPGTLIGWIAGFFNWQIFAGILWGIIIILTYPGLWRKRFRKVGTLTYFLALFQAGLGFLIAFLVGNVTH
jgi:hypothetical protein